MGMQATKTIIGLTLPIVCAVGNLMSVYLAARSTLTVRSEDSGWLSCRSFIVEWKRAPDACGVWCVSQQRCSAHGRINYCVTCISVAVVAAAV